MARCQKCGAELSEGALFCHICGTPIRGKRKKQSEYYYTGSYKKHRKKNTAVIVLLCILIALVLMVAAAVASYMFMGRSSETRDSYDRQNMNTDSTPAADPYATPVPVTPEPVTATKKPDKDSSSNVHVANPKYSTYTDPELKFSCAYPSHFEKYIDNTTTGRYTLKNEDGSVTLKICAEENDGDITIQQALSMFTSKNSGNVEYSSSGSTYFAVRVNSDGICKYRYLKSSKGYFYWFDMSYPEEYRDIYEEYIQHIYTSFTVK